MAISIEKTGSIVIKPQFDWAGQFSEGLAVVKIQGKRGYINKKGDAVILPGFSRAEEFSEGLAIVLVDGNTAI
jgi:hypothetical protein